VHFGEARLRWLDIFYSKKIQFIDDVSETLHLILTRLLIQFHTDSPKNSIKLSFLRGVSLIPVLCAKTMPMQLICADADTNSNKSTPLCPDLVPMPQLQAMQMPI
jgi:hypothetical protein